MVRVLLVQILACKKNAVTLVHLRRHDSQQPLLLQHHRVAGRKLSSAPQKRGGKLALQLLAHTTRRYIKQTAR